MNKGFNLTLVLNYVSLGFMAISGLIMNTVIAVYYGAETLGIFSETYAWYLIISQLAVWGIHVAIVKMVPAETENEKKESILKTGLLLVTLISLFVTVVSEVVLVFLNDLPWRRTMQIAFTGFSLLSVNKVLLNYLNAIYRMNAYAIFTSLRYICFGLIIFLESYMETSPDLLALVFPLTEIIVFIFMSIYFLNNVRFKGAVQRKTVGDMMYFGTKIIPSYMVLELNTKVDIVCLGALMPDVSQIGIYSFAILFTEGFYMLYVTIRKIINPDISRASSEGNLQESIKKISNKLKKYIVFGGPIAYVALLVSYLTVCAVLDKQGYFSGLIYILIIGVSILINSRSIIFGDLLAQAGLPLEESILNVATVGVNFLLNIVMILSFGTIGAAIATAVSYSIFNIYMRYRARRRLGVTI